MYYKQILFTISVFFIAAIAANESFAQSVDANFYPVVTNNDFSSVKATAIQPDGKIIIAGYFNSVNGTAQSGVARLLTDGTTDSTFGANAGSNGLVVGSVYDIKILTNGKILIAGNFYSVAGQARRSLARLNADGSLDTSFVPSFPDINVFINEMVIQPDGKIIIGGGFSSSKNLLRLNSNGSIDNTFQNSVPSSQSEVINIARQPDGKLLTAYRIYENNWKTKFVRFHSNGTLDATFLSVEVLGTGTNAGGSFDIDAIMVQPDGRIIIGGSLRSVNGVNKNHLARLNADGSIDDTFQGNTDKAVFSITSQSDGKILIGGIFSKVNGIVSNCLARLHEDGSLDVSLSSQFSADVAIYTVSQQSDGKLIVGGSFMKIGNERRYHIARLNTDGNLDTDFAFVFVGSPGLVHAIVPRSDGKIFIGGSFSQVDGETHRRIALLEADGKLDSSFPDLSYGDNFDVNTILPLPNNQVLVGGRLFAFVNTTRYSDIVPYNSDGTVNTNFKNTRDYGSIDAITSMVLQPDGKIIIGGSFALTAGTTRNNIARLNSDGTLDTTFLTNLPGANYAVGEIALQPDGKILISGYFTQVNGETRNKIARLNPDGTLDTTFQNNMPGVTSSNPDATDISSLIVQPDRKILISGNFDTVNGIPRNDIARLNSDGSLDTSFSNVQTGANTLISSMARRQNGQILITGGFKNINGQARTGLAQLNDDGSLDSSFNIIFNPLLASAYSLAIENNGNVLVGGNFGLVNGIPKAGIFRIKFSEANAALFDYDGDGKSDISVFRPDTGVWHLQQSQSNYAAIGFGLSTDKLVSADYDGDGKTDLAVFRENPADPGKAKFFILQSSNNQLREEQFGSTGDIPVAGDWDGDGRSDIGVYRSGTASSPQGYFYYRPSSQPTVDFVPNPWGITGDKPVVADYDGDGKTDTAVFRPSTGEWFVQRSRDGFYAIQFGAAEDKPVAADYDGDGKIDQAVFRPSNGVWYMWNSSIGFSAAQFGISTDKPVPADYDGDGKTDVAVYRDGTWFILNSTTGFAAIGFGNATDKPVPNAFTP